MISNALVSFVTATLSATAGASPNATEPAPAGDFGRSDSPPTPASISPQSQQQLCQAMTDGRRPDTVIPGSRWLVFGPLGGSLVMPDGEVRTLSCADPASLDPNDVTGANDSSGAQAQRRALLQQACDGRVGASPGLVARGRADVPQPSNGVPFYDAPDPAPRAPPPALNLTPRPRIVVPPVPRDTPALVVPPGLRVRPGLDVAQRPSAPSGSSVPLPFDFNASASGSGSERSLGYSGGGATDRSFSSGGVASTPSGGRPFRTSSFSGGGAPSVRSVSDGGAARSGISITRR